MAKAILMTGGSGGDYSDDCNVTADYVVKGKTYIGADTDDEVGLGALELTGNTASNQVLNGATFYNNNPHQKNTGTMLNYAGSRTTWCGYETVTVQAHPSDPNNQALIITPMSNNVNGFYNTASSVTANVRNLVASNIKDGVMVGRNGGDTSNCIRGTFTSDATASANQVLSGYTAYVKGVKLTGTAAVQSILSFNCAVYSSTAITFTWQNPAKGAFSGVIIVGKAGSYPTGINDGTRYYKGYGTNSAANGISATTIYNFVSGTTYYFRAFSYAILNNSEWLHGANYTGAAATTRGIAALTSSGIWTVPAGVRSIDVFCVGGGSSGHSGSTSQNTGAGGGAGYTATQKGISVTPGQQITYTIGAGGAIGNGGITTFNGFISAAGGKSPESLSSGGNGGSGGGTAGFRLSTGYSGRGGFGGSDGSDGGYNSKGNGAPGNGQGTTTRAFGESSNTLYAGGGGGGTYGTSGEVPHGGAGGGGSGAYLFQVGEEDYRAIAATSGTANTGSAGGGGRNGVNGPYRTPGNGGSGVILVRWGY